MQRVLIKIKAHQEIEDRGAGDVMELMTEGRWFDRNGAVYIIYEETELSGVPGCVTALKAQGDCIRLRRYGVNAQEMRFETGKRFVGMYDTPMGIAEMEIWTHRVENHIVPGRFAGSLTVEYEIELKGMVGAYNTLNIQVAPLS